MIRPIIALLLVASCGGVMPSPKPMAVPQQALPVECPAEPEALPTIASPEVLRARHDKLQLLYRECRALYRRAKKALESAQAATR